MVVFFVRYFVGSGVEVSVGGSIRMKRIGCFYVVILVNVFFEFKWCFID